MKRAILYVAKSALALVLSLGLTGFVLVPLKTQAALNKRIFLTSGTTWTVPADWNSSSNSVETIGGGGSGGTNSGGGGGAYASASNISLTPGASVTYQIGSSGSDTVFNSTATTCAGSPTPSVCADGGVTGVSSTNGAGGTTANSIGTTKYAGGTGASGSGGGAAGPRGAGGDANAGGGGTGGAGFGGAGGGIGEYDAEPPGFCIFDGQNGSSGTEYSTILAYGSGGGGGYGTLSCASGDGAAFGGGGGGSGASPGGAGGIIITYTSTEVPSSSYAQFKILGWSVRIIGGKVVIK